MNNKESEAVKIDRIDKVFKVFRVFKVFNDLGDNEGDGFLWMEQ